MNMKKLFPPGMGGHLGPGLLWAGAALTTMFSTTLTCLDAFSRVMKESTGMIFLAGFGSIYIFLTFIA